MKPNTLLLAAMLMASVAGNAQTTVKVSGQIKGISDSCQVSLDDVEEFWQLHECEMKSVVYSLYDRE